MVSINSKQYGTNIGFVAGTPQQEAVPRGWKFSRIENLWPRGGSCARAFALTPLGKGVFMDIEVNRMSPAAVELLDQLSVVCKRFNVEYATASEKDRFFVEAVALHECQLKKAHEQGLKRSEVPPFLGLKRTDHSNDMPA